MTTLQNTEDSRFPFEVVGNFHVHTVCSDGTGTHQQIAQAAAEAGLDVLMYTDHNLRTEGVAGWYVHPKSGRRVLLLMGEEVHDEAREPSSVNHYLSLGAEREVNTYAAQAQAVIDAVNRYGGVGFIAHPFERPLPIFDETSAFPWVDWQVSGYAGIELWNYLTEFKSGLSSQGVAVLAVFFPDMFINGPFRETLELWDRLLASGQRVVAIGGADAHAQMYRLGPFKKRVFPYRQTFQTINTHLLLQEPLAEDWRTAQSQVLEALRNGHAFVSYRPAGCARGFRFTAEGQGGTISMGDEALLKGPMTLRVRLPLPAHLRLLKDGCQVASVYGRQLTFETDEPGVYRVEAHRSYHWLWAERAIRRRPWIFSNPIYLRVAK